MPLIILWIFIIPSLIFGSLYKNRNRLDVPVVRYSLGFLYNEYRKEIYYWEMLKISLKLIITVVLNLYES